jgi:hypothetical protein
MKLIVLFSFLVLQVGFRLLAQNVTILPSGITPAQGGGIDRMTTPARTNTAFQNAQVPGKLVFDVDKGNIYMWDGYQWNRLLQDTPDEIGSIGITTTDASGGDRIGVAVSIKGNWAVIGAAGEDSDEGEAYIFKKEADGWVQKKRLRQDITAANTAISAGAKFGIAVDIENFTVSSIDYPMVVVGAPEQPTGGRAFVFRFNGTDWVLQTTLSHINPSAGDDFGHSVSISSGKIAVGAPYDDVVDNSLNSFVDGGSVTIYTNTSPSTGGAWTRQTVNAGEPTYIDDSPAATNYFGFSVAIDNLYLAVGVPLEGSTDRGKVALINTNTNTLIRSFSDVHLAAIDDGAQIGFSVALSGANLLIGVPFDDVSGTVDAGTAHLVRNSSATWTSASTVTITKIYNPFYQNTTNATSSNFGRSVSINGNYMMIGAPNFKNGATTDIGYAIALQYNSAYFTNADYNFVNSPSIKINNPYSTSGREFGRALGISSDGNFVIGAPLDDSNWSGRVHFGNLLAY